MISIIICIAIVIASLLYLIGWFFDSMNKYQQHIDEETE